MTELPHADQAQVDSTKITDYLLSSTHPDGRNKAAFLAAFGFRVDEPEVLRKALQKHGATQWVTRTVESRYGVRYVVEGALETPDGRNPVTRTVWIVDHESGVPRLITAYPV